MVLVSIALYGDFERWYGRHPDKQVGTHTSAIVSEGWKFGLDCQMSLLQNS